MSRCYLIQCEVTGLIKIGFAADPWGRMMNMQTGCPTPLRLLGTLPGGAMTERRLHRCHSASLVRGEWFSLSKGEILALLAEPGSAIGAASRVGATKATTVSSRPSVRDRLVAFATERREFSLREAQRKVCRDRAEVMEGLDALVRDGVLVPKQGNRANARVFCMAEPVT